MIHYPLLQAWGLVSTHCCSHIRSCYRIKPFPWHIHTCQHKPQLELCVTDCPPSLGCQGNKHHKFSPTSTSLDNSGPITDFTQLTPFNCYSTIQVYEQVYLTAVQRWNLKAYLQLVVAYWKPQSLTFKVFKKFTRQESFLYSLTLICTDVHSSVFLHRSCTALSLLSSLTIMFNFTHLVIIK